MSKTYVVYTCAHATPEVSNERFSWLGNFIFDLKPDVVVDLGDRADMSSLNSYDTKYPKAIVSQNYQRDISCYHDSQERLWHRFRHSKKKMPLRVGFEGNHEHRIKKAIAHDPRIEGDKYGISFKHLETKSFYDHYHEYAFGAPSVATYDGIAFSHFISAGNFGKPLSGTHHAYALLQSRHCSVTVGHSHKRSLYFKDGVHGKGIIGLVAGNFKGGKDHWAGQSQDDWWSGVVVKREVDNGYYEPQFISLKTLERDYGDLH